VISGFSMAEGQLPRQLKRGVLWWAFSVARKDIHCFGPAPASVGIVDRKEAYVS
jgi:hypothetical protein